MVAGTSSTTFINEFHYDNVGTDVGEFVEIAALVGTSLAGWTLLLYNGNGGIIYNTIDLGAITPTTVGGRNFYNVPIAGIQNGAPDGFALVDNNGNVVQFLSYEGTFTASTGPAAGLLSTDVGVSQGGITEAVGTSLQLIGTGTTAGDFTWGPASIASTAGAANTGQIFTDAGGEPNQAPDGTDATFSLLPGATRVLTVEDFGFTDPDGDAFDSVIFTTLPTSGTLLLDADGDPGTAPIAVFAGASIAIQEIAAGQLFYVADDALGSDSFTFQVVDEGGTDFGGTDTDPTPNTLTFNVTAAQSGTLSIGDASVIEGDSGTTDLVFTVTRSGGSAGAVSASYSLTNTTTSNNDFTGPTSGTVTFADGQTTATITISVVGDTNIEIDESFDLTLFNPTGGATITDNMATGTIFNDDLPPQGPPEVFINEVHYDTAGADVGEFVEIAGPAGTNLTGWSLVLYNGNGGVVYGTIALSGVIPNQDDGFGTLGFLTPGLQNGAPDGFALVGPAGQVVQFLSYEGTLTATNGPAVGLTSTDIGVSENSAPLGSSLQAGGTGFTGNDFAFQSSQTATFGQINAGQDFVAANPNGTLFVQDARVVEGDSGATEITFNVFRVGGSTGAVTVDFAAAFGSAFTDANASDLAGSTAGSISFADGETFKAITLQVAGDTVGEPTEFFRLELSNVTGGASIGDGVAVGTIANDDPLILQIGEIQGAGHTSIYENNEVTTSGIVTAVATNGFYLQAPEGDGNAATSDAIFVFTGTAPTVVAGDAISVTGTVNEFRGGNDPSNLTITQLVSPVITVESSGNALPTAVLIGPDGLRPPTEIIDDDDFSVFDPENDGIDFFESLEGMLVTIQNPVAIDTTSGFGELYTVASDGAGNLAATNVSESGLVTVVGGIDDLLGSFNSGVLSDFNPERIQIDEAGALNGVVNAIPVVTPGTVLNNVTGVVDYAFGNFQIRPTEAVTVAQTSTNVAETTSLVTGAANQLAIATYNVLNLDIRADDGDDDVGSGRLANIARDIGVSLSAPDIVVLQEIQDDSGAINDGTTSALLTLQALADSIFDQTGIRYSVFDNPFVVDGQTGGQPGGNIRVAFLYRDDRVDLDEASVFTITDPENGQLAAAFQGSRAPLGANFTFNGETVTVIGNHFTSKIGSNSTFSANQPPLNAAELTRAAQAAAVNDYVDGLLAVNPDALVAVAGDFNEFQFEEPLRVLTGELEFNGASITGTGERVLQNLTFLLAQEERFTALFEGNAQAIDHILASRALALNAQVDIVHTNTVVGNPNADHDPVLAIFNIGSQTLNGTNGFDTIVGNDGIDVVNGFNRDDIITTFAGDDIIDGGFGNDTIDAGDGNDTILGGGGSDIIEAGRGNDFIDGGSGNDRINGGNGVDTIFGGSGNDIIDGGFSADLIDAGDGNDMVSGGEGSDVISGGSGRDIINGDAGNDTIDGGIGNDVINGGTGIDFITGGEGDDIIDAGDGNDTVQGSAGNDRISGGNGVDRLEGGAGLDTLTGGAGNDRFVLRADLTAADADVINDFTNLEDRFLLEGATGKTIAFTQSGANTLITADGVLVATVRGALAAEVEASTQIVAPTIATIAAAPEAFAAASIAEEIGASLIPNAAMIEEVSHSFGSNAVDPLAIFGDAPFVFAASAPASNIGAVAVTAEVPVLTVSALFGSSEADLAGGPASVALDALVNPLNNPWLAHAQFGLEPVG